MDESRSDADFPTVGQFKIKSMIFGKRKDGTAAASPVQPRTRTRIMRFRDIETANTWAENHNARITGAQVFQISVNDADTGRKKTVVYSVYCVMETAE